jgi:hypothetical protein
MSLFWRDDDEIVFLFVLDWHFSSKLIHLKKQLFSLGLRI